MKQTITKLRKNFLNTDLQARNTGVSINIYKTDFKFNEKFSDC